MPTKTVQFKFTAFPPEVLKQVMLEMGALALKAPWGFAEERPTDPLHYVQGHDMTVSSGTTRWDLENLDEYFAETRRPHEHAYVRLSAWMTSGDVVVDETFGSTRVAVKYIERAQIARIMGIFVNAGRILTPWR